MKLDDEKITGQGDKIQRISKKPSTSTAGYDQQNETPQSSTVRSLDFAPKEYETQLQLYESEVRNHIKCEQQLKLHIEVLQEKIDELEKEKTQIQSQHEMEMKELEERYKMQYVDIIQSKEKDLKILKNELKQAQSKILQQIQVIEQQKALQISQQSIQQQNLISSIQQNQQLLNSSTSNQQQQRLNTSQSKSPPSHGNIMANNVKIVKTLNKGKSPYLNDCFYKLIGGNSVTVSNNGQISSNNSSAKSNRKTTHQNNIAETLITQETQSQSKKVKSQANSSLGGNSIQENMKIIAAIQRMRMGNQPGLNLNQGLIVNPQSASQQQHKKNKSFSHYGHNTTSSAGRSITQSSHYNPSDFQNGANMWSAQEINNTFQTEKHNHKVIDNTASAIPQGVSNFNQKMLLIGNNGGRIQIIENLNINSQKNNSQIFQTQQPHHEQNQALFTKVHHQDFDGYQRKKSTKKSSQKSKNRDTSSQSGRGKTQSSINPAMFATNSTLGNNIHHRIYSIDMIENQMEGGNLFAANNQDFSKNTSSTQGSQNPSHQRNTNGSSNLDQHQKKLLQQQISHQRVVRLMNFICALAMVLDAVFRAFDFQKQSDPFYFLLTFYLLGFAALIVLAEIRYRKVLVYLEFLKSRLGKGMYIILVGLLVFDETRKLDMFTGIGLVLVGLFNIIVACMRDVSAEEKQDYEKAQMHDPENEYQHANDMTQDQSYTQQNYQSIWQPGMKYQNLPQYPPQDMKFEYKLNQQNPPNKFKRGQDYQTKRHQ
eukprot:403370320